MRILGGFCSINGTGGRYAVPGTIRVSPGAELELGAFVAVSGSVIYLGVE